jgi:OOP family OmpA-OmpF porin
MALHRENAMTARVATALAVCFMLLSSTSPSAEDSPGYPLHAGFALGFASAGSDCDYYGHNCDGTDTTFKIYAGKRVHENLGLEIAYHDLGKLRDQGFTSSTTAESQGVNLSLLGIIPTSNLGYFYGKAGYMWWDADYTTSGSISGSSDESGSDFTYGAGFAFTFSPDYDFRIELERLNELGEDFTGGGAAVTVLYIAGSINFN